MNMPKKDIFEKIQSNDDHRGSFVEMLKTEKSGQFAFFDFNSILCFCVNCLTVGN